MTARITIPPQVQALLRQLNAAGFSAYAVGRGYEKVLCDRFLVAPPLFFGENSPRENQDTGE